MSVVRLEASDPNFYLLRGHPDLLKWIGDNGVSPHDVCAMERKDRGSYVVLVFECFDRNGDGSLYFSDDDKIAMKPVFAKLEEHPPPPVIDLYFSIMTDIQRLKEISTKGLPFSLQ